MKEKVLIVDTVSYERAPYIKIYEDCCIKNNIDYDIFVWNREENGDLEKKGRVYIFNHSCHFGVNKIKKILPLYKYQKRLREVIQKGNYTKLIMISSIAPVIISDLLIKKFKGNYILDIRDYTYEKFYIYKKIIMKLINNASFCSISSKGFLKFLDNSSKFVVSHNITNQEAVVDKMKEFTGNENLIIGFVGRVRYFEENKNLIQKLSKSRFVLKYVGDMTEDCNLISFCEENNYKNVIFEGAFSNKDKPQIYKSIDIINSIYGTKSLEVTTALPNRLYDALLYKKPILASQDTYLGYIVEKYGIGIAVDIFNDDINKRLEEFLNTVDVATINKNFQKLLMIIEKEQNYYIKRINDFIIKNDF